MAVPILPNEILIQIACDVIEEVTDEDKPVKSSQAILGELALAGNLFCDIVRTHRFSNTLIKFLPHQLAKDVDIIISPALQDYVKYLKFGTFNVIGPNDCWSLEIHSQIERMFRVVSPRLESLSILFFNEAPDFHENRTVHKIVARALVTTHFPKLKHLDLKGCVGEAGDKYAQNIPFWNVSLRESSRPLPAGSSLPCLETLHLNAGYEEHPFLQTHETPSVPLNIFLLRAFNTLRELKLHPLRARDSLSLVLAEFSQVERLHLIEVTLLQDQDRWANVFDNCRKLERLKTLEIDGCGYHMRLENLYFEERKCRSGYAICSDFGEDKAAFVHLRELFCLEGVLRYSSRKICEHVDAQYLKYWIG